MLKVIPLLLFLLMSFFPREALTSQVQYVDSDMTPELIAQSADAVVIVKPSDKWETYREEVFHVETPPGEKPIEDMVYKEDVQLYEVVEVLKSDLIKPGQTIKVWTKSPYSYEDMKSAHKTGRRVTGAILQYKATSPPKEGENRILFLGNKESGKSVYIFAGVEGILILPEIKNFLNK